MSTRKPTTSAPPAPKVPPVSELPVTRAMLMGVRDELLTRIDGTNARLDETNARLDETNARLDETNARFVQVDARFAQVDARFDQMDARFDQMDARFDALRADVRAEVHRLGTLAEEQEARNRVVIEVVQGHNARFERIEKELADVRGMVYEILEIVKQRPRE